MNDDDFKQTVLDWMGIEQHKQQERHESIMAQASDILSKITAVDASLDAMKAKFDKTMTDMAATVPAGHAAVLDTLAPPLDALVSKVETLGTEMEAKTKALPVPGAMPSA